MAAAQRQVLEGVLLAPLLDPQPVCRSRGGKGRRRVDGDAVFGKEEKWQVAVVVRVSEHESATAFVHGQCFLHRGQLCLTEQIRSSETTADFIGDPCDARADYV